MRRLPTALATGAVAGALAMCLAVPASSAPTKSASPGHKDQVVFADFVRYHNGATAVTYDPQLVPVGARALVRATTPGQRTAVRLVVTGLVPQRQYGAHVHTNSCGSAPADSGPHYQHRVDPVSPSVDPAYANPRNEIWLDFTTNNKGTAVVFAEVEWQFTKRRAQSIVLHFAHTSTHQGHAGTAGARLACINVSF